MEEGRQLVCDSLARSRRPLADVVGVQIVPIPLESLEGDRDHERDRSGSDIGNKTVRLLAGQQNFDTGARQGLERGDDCPPIVSPGCTICATR